MLCNVYERFEEKNEKKNIMRRGGGNKKTSREKADGKCNRRWRKMGGFVEL